MCMGLVAEPAAAQVVVGSSAPNGGAIRLIDLTGSRPVRDLLSGSTALAIGLAADENTATLYWIGSGGLLKASYTAFGPLRAVAVGPMLSEGLGLYPVTGLAYDTAAQ